ncbi:MAG: hypothetical protein ACT4O9_11945 [Blastocatellia bacterium]
MHICRSVVFGTLMLMLAASGFANGVAVEELAKKAVSDDTVVSKGAITELRTLGQKGVDALIAQFAAEIKEFSELGEATDEWRRIAYAIDTVAMQKDAYASGLYWYTDLNEAKRVAEAREKPILSLRLLGNLNEEFSCANSRLFRAILYPNNAISKFLRENYVLHWKSVRPAPRVTIDFGDGRKIERTITGNSIHYILDENVRIIDALPGLYSPKAFMIYLAQGKRVNDSIDGFGDREKDLALLRYRKLSFDRIREKRESAIKLTAVNLVEHKAGTRAIDAAPLAASKMVVTDEISILRVYDTFSRYEPQIDFSDWQKLANLYSPNPELDASTTAFVRRQNAKTGRSEAEINGMFAKLKNYINLDTTRNDFLYHMKLYEWLNRGSVGDLESFNSRVYADIFQTPDSDKWFGLYSSDVYTALDGNGIVK